MLGSVFRWIIRPILTTIIGRLVIALLHLVGIFPGQWLAERLMEAPTSEWVDAARWLLAAVFASVILVGYEIWKHRKSLTARKKSKTASQSITNGCEVSFALHWIVEFSSWMRWQEAQHLADNGKSLDDMTRIHLAETMFRMRAENGEVAVWGRRRSQLTYEDIPPDLWKITYLDVQGDKMTLWRATMKARDGLDYEATKQIPDYVSLQVSEETIYKLWPKRDQTLDSRTKRLSEQAQKRKVS